MIMKRKIILIMFIVFSYAINMRAQVDISLTYNNNDVTNSTIELKDDVEMYIHVTNTGATDMNVEVEITDIAIPHKAPSIYACWNVCVYP